MRVKSNMEQNQAMDRELFDSIIEKLCEPFPRNIMKARRDGHGYYIPIAHYIDRLNQTAGPYWSHERVGDPIFYHEDRLVYTRVKVTIFNRSHEGEGFSKYQVDDQNRIINRHYAIRSATKDAIRDAITFFGMGMDIDTSQTSKLENTNISNERKCLKCSASLTDQDIDMLSKLNLKFDYCVEHIPKHFLK